MLDNPISPITVVIASSLKPVKDIRAWGKLGISLRETSKYTLNIIGFSGKKIEKTDDANFYSSQAFGRSWMDRAKAMFQFTKLLLKLRPKILICCTYEFLPLARFFKRVIGYKLVYDVQENYVANLDLNPLLTPNQRKWLSKIIQRLEKPKGIDLFLLAESCYQKEMPEKKPYLILENKYEGEIKPRIPKNYNQNEHFRFLISGTLSPVYGTLEAIKWFKLILKFYPKSSLAIIGHVPLNFYKNEIEKLAKNEPSIFLNLSETPLPHASLIKAYGGCDFLLLPYQFHNAIWDKIPTKLFESAALAVPVLITPNPKWEDFLEEHHSGFSINFLETESALLHFQQAISKSYFTQTPDSTLLWSSQKLAFTEAIDLLTIE